MSAIDRGSGSSMEEPERPVGPQADADGRENVTDTGAGEASGSTARSEVPPSSSDAAPAADPHPGQQRETPEVRRSEVPLRPARHQGPFAPGHTAHQPGPGQHAPGQPGPDQSASGPPPSGQHPSGPFGSGQHASGPHSSGPHAPAPSSEWARQPEWFERATAHQVQGHQQHTGGWATPSPRGAFSSHGGGFPPPPHDAPAMPGAAPPETGQRRRGRVVLVAAATALLTSLVVGPAASVATAYLVDGETTNSTSSTSAATGDVSRVADKALPSVVSISTAEGGGSGFIISSDGLIVTNNHVVSGTGEVTVAFNDGSQAEATTVGTDPVSDLAVIQAEGVSGLTPATLGDSDQVAVGARVVAIGAPLGLSGTVTSGVISALERPVNTGVSGQQPDSPFTLPPEGEQDEPQATTSTVIDAIQTDAPINPGNSGGPLMNMDGEVIGINTAIATTSGGGLTQSGSIGLGFAIPINQAKPTIDELVTTGEATYAAIEAAVTVAEDGSGAELVDVTRGGAADQAGLQAGDVIVGVGNRAVTDPNVLIAEIRSHRPGDTVTVTYERDGRTAEAQVTLSAQSSSDIGN
ncbi:trypsin-like peptidase domain-containing protein [Thermobifida halotolerans]|uniref:Trypsin-like peptidase domain-containing protein n=1 Tax=Thermobifida halotolerans TaxID=483545 RepID=A0A399G1N6_9ACTN|nr:trypsin-like peptidase domain-containing protein [Thermobifida halotolerans]UOE19424.1 trypsin-like peptidase domain-containing protein [Thermobifida halotolerans]